MNPASIRVREESGQVVIISSVDDTSVTVHLAPRDAVALATMVIKASNLALDMPDDA